MGTASEQLASQSVQLPITDLGSSAQLCLAEAARRGYCAEVVSVFYHCCYIALPTSTLPRLSARSAVASGLRSVVLCIGHSRISSGPINLLFANEAHWAAFKLRAVQGSKLQITQHSLILQEIQCNYDQARQSRHHVPLASQQVRGAPLLRKRLEQLCQHAPSTSLAAPLFTQTESVATDNTDALQHAYVTYFSPICHSFAEQLGQLIERKAFGITGAGSVLKLIGAGNGLTPAGDDLLAGVLLCAHYLGQREFAAQLLDVIQPALPEATNPISATLLMQAGQGLAGELMCSVFKLLDSPAPFRAEQIMQLLDQQGHTSGWDSLAGMVLFTRAISH